MPMNINGDFETVDFVENRHIIVYDNIQNDEYPVHWHNSIEIIMPLAEKYIVSCSGEKYILNEREILIIPAGTLHQIDAQNGRRIFLIMDYNTISCNPALNYISAFMQSPIHLSLESDEEILSKLNYIIQEIYREYFNFNATSEIYIYIKFLTLLYDVVKYKMLGNSKTESSESDKIIEMTIKYIYSNYMYDINLDILAKVSGYNKFYFSKMFYKYTNSSVPDFVNRCRIKAAELLLADNKYNITDIAGLTGFSSITTFNRVFKKINKCAPSKFRKFNLENHTDIFLNILFYFQMYYLCSWYTNKLLYSFTIKLPILFFMCIEKMSKCAIILDMQSVHPLKGVLQWILIRRSKSIYMINIMMPFRTCSHR